jgi:hypothetical protein
VRALLTRAQNACAVLNDRPREWHLRILTGVNPEIIQPHPKFQRGPEADIPFAKGYEGRKKEYIISGKVVFLQFIEVEKRREKVANRQT